MAQQPQYFNPNNTNLPRLSNPYRNEYLNPNNTQQSYESVDEFGSNNYSRKPSSGQPKMEIDSLKSYQIGYPDDNPRKTNQPLETATEQQTPKNMPSNFGNSSIVSDTVPAQKDMKYLTSLDYMPNSPKDIPYNQDYQGDNMLRDTRKKSGTNRRGPSEISVLTQSHLGNPSLSASTSQDLVAYLRAENQQLTQILDARLSEITTLKQNRQTEIVEKIVEKPVFIEKVVEKQIPTPIEKPVYIEKVIEKPIQVQDEKMIEELNKLKMMVNYYRDMEKEFKNLAENVKKLESANQKYNIDNSVLLEKVNQLQTDKERYLGLERELGIMSEKLRLAVSDKERFSIVEREYKLANDMIKQRIDDKEAQYDKLKQLLADKEKEFKQCQEENEKMKKGEKLKEELEGKLAQKEAELEEANQKLMQAEKTAEKHRHEKEAIKSASSKRDESNVEKDNIIANLTAKLQVMDQTFSNVEIQMNQAYQIIEDFNNKLRLANEKDIMKDKEIANLRIELATAKEKDALKNVDIINMNAKLAGTQKELQNKENEIKNLSMQNSELQVKLSESKLKIEKADINSTDKIENSTASIARRKNGGVESNAIKSKGERKEKGDIVNAGAAILDRKEFDALSKIEDDKRMDRKDSKKPSDTESLLDLKVLDMVQTDKEKQDLLLIKDLKRALAEMQIEKEKNEGSIKELKKSLAEKDKKIKELYAENLKLAELNNQKQQELDTIKAKNPNQPKQTIVEINEMKIQYDKDINGHRMKIQQLVRLIDSKEEEIRTLGDANKKVKEDMIKLQKEIDRLQNIQMEYQFLKERYDQLRKKTAETQKN